MFKWSVIIYTTNQQGGVSQSITAYDTEKQAEDKFFDNLSKLGGNEQTRYLRVELRNADGELVDWKVRKNEPAKEANA